MTRSSRPFARAASRRPFHAASLALAGLLPLLAAPGCIGGGSRTSAALPPGTALLHSASRLFDARSGAEVPWSTALEQLAEADVVFLGETHLDRLTHDAELEFLRQLAARRGGQVVLAMEMFERDVQPVLDDYLAGRIDERQFLLQSRPWGNYATDYRPLVEFCKANGLPVVASNLPADLRRKLARGGAAAHAALTPEERALLPERLIENRPEYWKRVDHVTAGHAAMGIAAAESRLYEGQNLWDNSMGDAVARALAAHPGAQVVHVNGGFHSDYGDGTVWQLLQRAPDATVATVQIVATSDLPDLSIDTASPRADFLCFVEARAKAAEDGVAAVTVAREHGWRMTRPHGAAGALPLLIWFCDDGQESAAAQKLWQPVVGDGAVVITLDPSFPYVGSDGAKRGRWFFPGAADAGGSLASRALDRLFEVVARADLAEGLRIDPARLVVAGEGSGATMVLHAARYLDEQGFAALAFAPRAQQELAAMVAPLDLAPNRPTRKLALHCNEAAADGWRSFTSNDGALRLATEVVVAPESAAASDAGQVDAVRAALGLAPLAARAAADAVIEQAPSHAAGRLVARQLARRVRAAALAEPPALAVTAAAFADGTQLPRSSGAFGGTTIVVVPEGDDAAFAAWKALEAPDVIQAKSRFHRLRIARGSGDESPRAVIEKLRAENAQRRDFLLVPAEFCVDDAALEALREGIGPLADELNLELLPGLGAALPIGPALPAGHGG
ncbi:MAG: ChaN family lipoprotein [Planctomycetes bacterium]|nr:ChaN family lipoprotein [Planctomycetota bacterium]